LPTRLGQSLTWADRSPSHWPLFSPSVSSFVVVSSCPASSRSERNPRFSINSLARYMETIRHPIIVPLAVLVAALIPSPALRWRLARSSVLTEKPHSFLVKDDEGWPAFSLVRPCRPLAPYPGRRRCRRRWSRVEGRRCHSQRWIHAPIWLSWLGNFSPFGLVRLILRSHGLIWIAADPGYPAHGANFSCPPKLRS
jgi:hypothetical protein